LQIEFIISRHTKHVLLVRTHSFTSQLEAIDFFISLNVGKKYTQIGEMTRKKAILFFQLLIDVGLIVHVVEKTKPFADDFLFFKFVESNPDRDDIIKVIQTYNEIKFVMGSLDSLDFLNQFYLSLSHPMNGVEIKDRSWRFRTYPKTFVGSEAVTWISKKYNIGKSAALILGEKMRDLGCFDHVVSQHPFLDEYYFYHMKPFKDFSGKCLKYLSDLHQNHETTAELTKEELYRNFTREDIQSVISKNRIYINEKRLSRKSWTDFSPHDCKDLFKDLTVEQLLKTMTPETTEKMNESHTCLKKMISLKKREALKELYQTITLYELQKDDPRLLTQYFQQIQEVVKTIGLCAEELSCWLMTKEEIIRNSDWMRLMLAVPDQTLRFFAKLNGKEGLIPDTLTTFRLELTMFETLLNCLSKKELIRAKLVLFKKDQEDAERESFGKSFMAQRDILFTLLDPKKFDETLKKFMCNEKIVSYLAQNKKNRSPQEIMEWIGQTQNIIVLTLCMMRTQEVLFLGISRVYGEFFNIDIEDVSQKEAFSFFCNFHNIHTRVDKRAVLLRDLTEEEICQIVSIIPDAQFKEIRLYLECNDRTTTFTSTENREILNSIPCDELENFIQFVKTKSKKRVSKATQKSENFITIFDYLFENGFDSRDLIGSLRKLMKLIEMEKQNMLQEYVQIPGSTKDKSEMDKIQQIVQLRNPLWIRYRGFLVAIVKDYKWIDREILFDASFLTRTQHLRSTKGNVLNMTL
jgi:hypothetical protein